MSERSEPPVGSVCEHGQPLDSVIICMICKKNKLSEICKMQDAKITSLKDDLDQAREDRDSKADVVRELIGYELLTTRVLEAIGAFVFGLGLPFVNYALWAKDIDNDDRACGLLVAGVLIFIGLAIFITNILTVIKIKKYPKLFILDYLKTFLP